MERFYADPVSNDLALATKFRFNPAEMRNARGEWTRDDLKSLRYRAGHGTPEHAAFLRAAAGSGFHSEHTAQRLNGAAAAIDHEDLGEARHQLMESMREHSVFHGDSPVRAGAGLMTHNRHRESDWRGLREQVAGLQWQEGRRNMRDVRHWTPENLPHHEPTPMPGAESSFETPGG